MVLEATNIQGMVYISQLPLLEASEASEVDSARSLLERTALLEEELCTDSHAPLIGHCNECDENLVLISRMAFSKLLR